MTTSYVIHAGQYKTRPNSVITRYGDRFEYASPEETPALMSDLVNWYNEEEKRGTLSPVELAALFHYRYIRIHPFEDGNGRIARLMVNFILFRHGYPMIVVRGKKKQEYHEALHKTDLKVGSVPSDGANARIEDITDFLKYFQNRMKEEIEFNISFLTERGENVWWFDDERINFRSETTSKILQMFRRNAFVSIQELMDVTGIYKSAVNKQLKLLREKKYIAKNEDTGEWRVIITPSI